MNKRLTLAHSLLSYLRTVAFRDAVLKCNFGFKSIMYTSLQHYPNYTYLAIYIEILDAKLPSIHRAIDFQQDEAPVPHCKSHAVVTGQQI